MWEEMHLGLFGHPARASRRLEQFLDAGREGSSVGDPLAALVAVPAPAAHGAKHDSTRLSPRSPDGTAFIREKKADMSADDLLFRIATPDDAAKIEALMKESTAALFPLFYDEQQTASAVVHVAQIDPLLLEDGTYFVIETGGELIACGGWSRRDKLYTGSGDSSGDVRLLDPSRSPRACERCSSAPTGHDAASAARSSRPAKPPPARKASAGSPSAQPFPAFPSTRPSASNPPASTTSPCPTATRSPASGWTSPSSTRPRRGLV